MFKTLLLLALITSPVSALAKNAEASENSESFLVVAIFIAIALYLMLKPSALSGVIAAQNAKNSGLYGKKKESCLVLILKPLQSKKR